MTLQQFIEDRKVLFVEYSEIRRQAALPESKLGWTKDAWSNRLRGRTELKDLEVMALDLILQTIRIEAKKKELETV